MRREILVTDFPGPPAEANLYLGKFGGGEYHAWMDALDVARAKAEELGYEIHIEDSQWLPESEGEEAPSEEEFLAELYDCWEEVEDE